MRSLQGTYCFSCNNNQPLQTVQIRLPGRRTSPHLPTSPWMLSKLAPIWSFAGDMEALVQSTCTGLQEYFKRRMQLRLRVRWLFSCVCVQPWGMTQW